jgi:hypothetical protein
LGQPPGTLSSLIDLVSFTTDPAAAIDCFQSILDAHAITYQALVTLRQFFQRSGAVIAVINRLQQSGLKKMRELSDINRISLVAFLE